MGVGPPRFGLRPGVGRRPGVDPTRDQFELRVVHYPGAAAYPGRGVYPFARFATRPSASLYPGTDLLIHVPVSRTDKRVSFVIAGPLSARRLGHFLRRAVFQLEARIFTESSLRSTLPPPLRVRFVESLVRVPLDPGGVVRVRYPDGFVLRVRIR